MDENDQFAKAFVCENLEHSYDFQKFTVNAILLREIQCKKGDILMFNSFNVFSANWLEKGKICKNYDHTCLFHCINTCRVPREMFEHSAYRPRVQKPSSGPGKC